MKLVVLKKNVPLPTQKKMNYEKSIFYFDDDNIVHFPCL